MQNGLTISGAAGAAVLPFTAVATAAIDSDTASIEVHELWELRAQLVAKQHKAFKDHNMAYARLPWWAARGPKNIDHRGSMVGDVSDYPANPTPPQFPGNGLFRTIRMSPWKARKDYETMRDIWGDERARRHYRGTLRVLVKRKRAQKVEFAG